MQYWLAPQVMALHPSVGAASQFPSPLESPQQAPATHTWPMAQLHWDWVQVLEAPHPLHASPVAGWKSEKPEMVVVTNPSCVEMARSVLVRPSCSRTTMDTWSACWPAPSTKGSVRDAPRRKRVPDGPNAATGPAAACPLPTMGCAPSSKVMRVSAAKDPGGITNRNPARSRLSGSPTAKTPPAAALTSRVFKVDGVVLLVLAGSSFLQPTNKTSMRQPPTNADPRVMCFSRGDKTQMSHHA